MAIWRIWAILFFHEKSFCIGRDHNFQVENFPDFTKEKKNTAGNGQY
jgi:hypothetical protein